MTTPRNTTLNLLAIAILCSATACSDATGPDVDPPPEPPQAQFETVTDVTLTLRYLTVSSNSACDGIAVISRKPRNGEFQYRVEGYRNGTRLETLQSSGYGSVTGAATSAGPGETIQFANETWRFNNLRSGDEVELRLRATEWDATSRDDYLNDLSASYNINIPIGPEDVNTVGLRVGTANCGLTLFYDRSITTREVEVG